MQHDNSNKKRDTKKSGKSKKYIFYNFGAVEPFVYPPPQTISIKPPTPKQKSTLNKNQTYLNHHHANHTYIVLLPPMEVLPREQPLHLLGKRAVQLCTDARALRPRRNCPRNLRLYPPSVRLRGHAPQVRRRDDAHVGAVDPALADLHLVRDDAQHVLDREVVPDAVRRKDNDVAVAQRVRRDLCVRRLVRERPATKLARLGEELLWDHCELVGCVEVVGLRGGCIVDLSLADD